jgi:hypothetical protein
VKPEIARIVECLEGSPYPEIRRLCVHLDQDHRVVLTGQVRTFYMKQMAQEVVRHINGDRVVNEVSVK